MLYVFINCVVTICKNQTIFPFRKEHGCAIGGSTKKTKSCKNMLLVYLAQGCCSTVLIALNVHFKLHIQKTFVCFLLEQMSEGEICVYTSRVLVNYSVIVLPTWYRHTIPIKIARTYELPLERKKRGVPHSL